MHIVYKHTCLSNGKSYVGFTPKKPVSEASPEFLLECRWRLHLREVEKGSQLAFHRAIRKYGELAFEHVVIEVCDSFTRVLEREKHWIAELNTFGRNGYNMTPGGEGVIMLSDEDRQKHKLATKRSMQDPVLKQRMKQAHLAVVSTPEHRRKNSDAQKIAQNRFDVKERRVIKNSLPETKVARSKASKAFFQDPEKRRNHLNACCKSNKKKSRQVTQMTLQGQVLNVFESCSQAAKQMGFNRSGISNCAAGRYATMNGFLWSYNANPGDTSPDT